MKKKPFPPLQRPFPGVIGPVWHPSSGGLYLPYPTAQGIVAVTPLPSRPQIPPPPPPPPRRPHQWEPYKKDLEPLGNREPEPHDPWADKASDINSEEWDTKMLSIGCRRIRMAPTIDDELMDWDELRMTSDTWVGDCRRR